MATKIKQWADGSSATIQYDGQGDGQIIITSDPNEHYEARSMQIAVETTDGSGIQKVVTVNQAAKQRIDISTAVVTANNQTYNGSAKTPTPTVTLNGTIIPSTGYDVTYSNNTNAGTATITVTGKGDYTGTASGTFTINKATPSYTAPATRSLTYSGSSQYLTTSGSTSHGTIYYSTNGSNWYTSRRTATNAGSYNCYWKLVGDSNHTDIGSTYLGTTSIAKASRTLSFADSYVVLNTSSTGTKTATPSAGSGDGAITYSIANTTYATINSSTGKVTSKTSDGSATVTATIAEGTNYLSASTSYTLYVFATTHNYSYTGSYSSVTLPPGTYQFQVWGAQGGSNSASSSWGITSKAGGKGGYSVGQLTIPQATGVRVYVGGQGTSDTGGYNGGGGGNGGSSYYSADNEVGFTTRAGGGGASDIRLSDGSLYSRMIVAGGGSGGAMCCRKVTTYVEREEQVASLGNSNLDLSPNVAYTNNGWYYVQGWRAGFANIESYAGKRAYITWGAGRVLFLENLPSEGDAIQYLAMYGDPNNKQVTIPSNAKYVAVTSFDAYKNSYQFTMNVVVVIQDPTTTTDYASQVGYAGGGTNGDGYSGYYGKQNGAGALGSWGEGATQHAQSWRYTSAAGGGGWYGGGRNYSNTDINAVKMSGGGSGFVNTAASAGNRPSGYTGLELDSGETYAGNTSFPAPGGGNETGHSGDGYIRITRIS